MTALHQQILSTPLPAFRENIRRLERKEWAVKVRWLFKDLGIAGLSVTTPNHSMASSINIRIPDAPWYGAHEAEHAKIDAAERSTGAWLGYGTFCPFCKETHAARKQIEAIILAAFPDLDDRSHLVEDYFDFCFTINC